MALLDLSINNIEYVLDTLPATNYVIKQEGLSNIKLLGRLQESIELSFGIRNDWPELVVIINKMIQSMSDEKRDQILNTWIKLNIEEKIDYTLIWKIVLGFLIILFFN